MSDPSLAAMLFAVPVALIAYLTSRRRGPFAWLLAHLGDEALQSSAYISRMLVIVAGGLPVFAVLCVLFPQHVAALAHWAPFAFIAIPPPVARLSFLAQHRAP